ncbi:MAG: Holliday junction branch migration protein RuvA [Clostridia bacterium]|nr:Holliday junction branch migration protein RuvA [Clostridia bacterium]
MISFLNGVLDMKRGNEAVVDVNGVGYKVLMSPDEFLSLKIGQRVKIYTYLNVRDDCIELYGFLSFERLQFFETLIKISGIGPKIALQITASISFNDFKNAVILGDTNRLKSLPGVGKKTAQKIILELKDVFKKTAAKVFSEEKSTPENLMEARQALEGLGFTLDEIDKFLMEAVSNFGKEAESEVLVRYVLQCLGNQGG